MKSTGRTETELSETDNKSSLPNTQISVYIIFNTLSVLDILSWAEFMFQKCLTEIPVHAESLTTNNETTTVTTEMYFHHYYLPYFAIINLIREDVLS